LIHEAIYLSWKADWSQINGTYSLCTHVKFGKEIWIHEAIWVLLAFVHLKHCLLCSWNHTFIGFFLHCYWWMFCHVLTRLNDRHLRLFELQARNFKTYLYSHSTRILCFSDHLWTFQAESVWSLQTVT